MSFRICQVCRKIPWDNLPSEIDPGHPHHASLTALKLSARYCGLCALILKAVDWVRERVDGKHRGRNFGGWASFVSHDLPDGRKVSTYASGGSYNADSDGSVSVGVPKDESWRSKPGYSFLSDAEARPWLYGSWFYSEPNKDKLQLLGLGVRVGKTGELIDGEGNGRTHINKGPDGKDHEYIDCNLHGTQLRISTSNDSSMTRIIPFRPRDLDASSKRNFNRVEEWIHTCERYHSCTAWAARLPTRVLDVKSSSETIVLKETAGEIDTYACLSYCWGTQKNLRTEKANLQSHKTGIAVADLPKSIRDAIFVCKQLDIPYLWVDALCIIQDDEVDRDREISKMADIYAKCFLTIAASSGKGAADGLLPSTQERQSVNYASAEADSLGGYIRANAAPVIHSPFRQTPPQLLAMWPLVQVDVIKDEELIVLQLYQEWLPSSSKRKPQNRNIGGFGRHLDPFEHEPITKRGWTLQERILSPRVLHYTKAQMYWECRWDLLAEDGSIFTSHRKPSLALLLNREKLQNSACGQQSMRGLGMVEGRPVTYDTSMAYMGGRWSGGWLALIEEYSKRSLGRDDDKLPALSGIARYLASITGNTYYAGLWQAHILEDLAWRMYPRTEYVNRSATKPATASYGPRRCEVRKPTSYRAPSWSWASMEGYIRFIPIDFDRVMADFVHGYIEPAGSDIYGKVKSGWIQLMAPVVEVLPHNPKDEIQPADKDLVLGELVQLNLAHGVSKGEAFFDLDTPTFPCFAIFLDSQNCILATSADTRNYQRVGMGRFSRTAHQRRTEPLASVGPLKSNNAPWGPIGSDVTKKLIIIQ